MWHTHPRLPCMRKCEHHLIIIDVWNINRVTPVVSLQFLIRHLWRSTRSIPIISCTFLGFIEIWVDHISRFGVIWHIVEIVTFAMLVKISDILEYGFYSFTLQRSDLVPTNSFFYFIIFFSYLSRWRYKESPCLQ